MIHAAHGGAAKTNPVDPQSWKVVAQQLACMCAGHQDLVGGIDFRHTLANLRLVLCKDAATKVWGGRHAADITSGHISRLVASEDDCGASGVTCSRCLQMPNR